MKKIIIIAISLLCVLFLASCNMVEQIEAFSDQLKSNILDMAGQFIEKDTSKNDSNKNSAPSNDNNIPDVIVSSTPNTSDVPDEPNVPDEPALPEYVAFQRAPSPLNRYVGFDIAHGGEYKHRYIYGYGRYIIALENALDADNISYFKISDMESAIQLDFDLALAKMEAGEEELSFSDIAYKLGAFANEFSSQAASWLYNTTRVEIGSNPDEKISASDYALLLNTIYDGNNKELAGVGTTFINPEMKFVTGTMSQINLDYIKELMSELEALRTDAFMPVGGWSFALESNGAAPEKMFFMEQRLQELINYREKNYKGIEIYLNGLGWDTENQLSPNYIAPKNGYTSEELQSAYILRSFLLASSFDIDRLSISTLKDTEENGEGIIGVNGTKKLAYNILEYFKSRTTDMSFVEIGSFTNELTAIYQDGNGNVMYAMWANGTTVETEILSGLAENITICTYDSTTKEYVETQEATDGSYALSVGDMPTFIFFNTSDMQQE